jgi:cyclic pyranopterin phosphate synthase
MSELTHFDKDGKAVMVEVGGKPETERLAVARGQVVMKAATLTRILDRNIEKGDVLAVARLAGIMAAKKTADIIPLCHPLLLTSIAIDFMPDPTAGTIDIEGRVKVCGKTGVEMEALHAVSAAALTIYDMCKAIDRGMTINSIQLLEKHGGKSGSFVRSDDSNE